eukprot:m.34902 g.34902  ORF g.34902 m.34902 type:complete len:209 (-) comp12350_c0_seq1:169-795(-)
MSHFSIILSFVLLVLASANRNWVVVLNLGVIANWPDMESNDNNNNAGFGTETVGSSLTNNGQTAIKEALSKAWGISSNSVQIQQISLNKNGEVEVALMVTSTTNPQASNASISFSVEYKGSNGQSLTQLVINPEMTSTLQSSTKDEMNEHFFIIYTAMSGVATALGVVFAITQSRQTRKVLCLCQLPYIVCRQAVEIQCTLSLGGSCS